MLKIALYHNLPSGGAKRAVYEWTRRLADSHVIDVYTLSTADHTFCDIRPFARKHHILDFIPHRLFASPWGRLNQLQRWRDLGELTRIGRYIADEINEGGYDVVFTHPCLYTFVPTMLRFVEIPTVYYLHEPFGPTFIRRFNRPYLDDSAKWRIVSKRFDPLLALYNHRLEHNRTASIRATTKLLANSQFTQQSVKREYRVDAAVCRCGVNSEDFHPLPDTQKEDFVLSVGELTPRKGFDFLIESIGHIPLDKRPSLKLICNFESPPERRFVEELATQWNVRLQIELNMNTEQLALEYNRALLCVYAPVLEALGLVPLESMACGTPVVGVAEGGVSETILHRETGLLTERDPRRFADAVEQLLGDPTRRAHLGQQGRLYVEKHWSWERSVRDLERYLAGARESRQAQTHA